MHSYYSLIREVKKEKHRQNKIYYIYYNPKMIWIIINYE